MGKTISEETRSKIRAARVAGLSMFEVAIEIGVDKATVSRHCSDIPRPANIRIGRARVLDYARVVELRAKGLKVDDIAERFGVTSRAVFRALASVRTEAAE